MYPQCGNYFHFKTYNECKERRKKVGWRDAEAAFYCTGVGLKT
jgi:hypothetical protein